MPKKRHRHVSNVFPLCVCAHSIFILTQTSNQLTDGRVILVFRLSPGFYTPSKNILLQQASALMCAAATHIDARAISLQSTSYVRTKVILKRFPLNTTNFRPCFVDTKFGTHCWFRGDHPHMSVLVTIVCQVFPKFGTGILLP